MKNLLLSCVATFCINFLATGQTTSSSVQPVIDVMNQLKNNYTNNPNLSFHVLYTFADEATPEKIEDSIPAVMQISNNRYHTQIGPTEAISNEHYSVMLFSEDKLMYITKPVKTLPDLDPMAKIDSAVLSIKGLTASVETQNDLKIIKIDFPDKSEYKSIWITVNSTTGFLIAAQFTIKDEALPVGQIPEAENLKTGSGYAIIRANYYDYSTSRIDDSVFNQDRYFTRDNKNFTTTEAYKDYRIFIGSPNL